MKHGTDSFYVIQSHKMWNKMIFSPNSTFLKRKCWLKQKNHAKQMIRIKGSSELWMLIEKLFLFFFLKSYYAFSSRVFVLFCVGLFCINKSLNNRKYKFICEFFRWVVNSLRIQDGQKWNKNKPPAPINIPNFFSALCTHFSYEHFTCNS